MSMTPSERAAKKMLENSGWTVYRPGWPDFLCVRGKEIKFIEVKFGGDPLRASQKQCLKILREHGLTAFIMRPSGELVNMSLDTPLAATKTIQCSHEMHYTKSGKMYYIAYSPKYIFKSQNKPTKQV